MAAKFQNISQLTDEEIRKLENNILVPGLLMQKYFKDLRMMKELAPVIFQLMSQLPEEGNFKQRSYVYFFDLMGIDKNEVKSTIKDLERFTEDPSQNYILQLMYKGREEGKEEGLQIAIVKLLKAGCSTQFICDTLEVSSELVERIRQEMGE